MTIRVVDRDLVVLEGVCPSEDAEVLLQRLLTAPTATVDLSGCQTLHAAVLQVLLAAERPLRLPEDDETAGRLSRLLHSVISR